MSSFVHLHVHSHHSHLMATPTPAGLLRKAQELNQPALALTDLGAMYGSMEFYSKARQLEPAKIKPIIGCEFYLVDSLTSFQVRRKLPPPERLAAPYPTLLRKIPYRLVVLAENKTGYRNLCYLNKVAFESGAVEEGYLPCLDFEALSQNSEGLLFLSGGALSQLYTLLRLDRSEAAAEVAKSYLDLLGRERFYLELQVHGDEIEKKVNAGLVALSKQLDLPVVATNEVFYLEQNEARNQSVLLAIKNKTTLAEWEKNPSLETQLLMAGSGYHLKSYAEMLANFSQLPVALKNTLVISERCALTLEEPAVHLPQYVLPAGETNESQLEKLTFHGLEKKLKLEKNEAAAAVGSSPLYEKRLHYELNHIKEMGFSSYFLIVQDFVNWAKKRDILVGPGRGSVAGSLVAYALGITEIDPLPYELLFERFMNPGRKDSLPDIDIDFQEDRRDEVIEYVRQKYGAERVCQIVTYAKLKARAAFKDVSRAYGINFEKVNRLTSLIPPRLAPADKERGKTLLANAYEKELGFRGALDGEPRLREAYEKALKIENLNRQTGVHACGIIIADRALTHYIPIAKNEEGIVISQYEHNLLEEKCGLVKMDFLGLKTLSLLKKTLAEVKKTTGRTLAVNQLPLDDGRTFRLFAEGFTAGIFQFESGGMTNYLQELRPSSIHELIAMNALYRPGPMAWIPIYIDKKHKRPLNFKAMKGADEGIDYEKSYHRLEKLCEQLKPLKEILAPTNLIPVYQEQIMQLCRFFAGFSLSKADDMRKAIGKKKRALIEEMRAHFISGAAELGHKKADAAFLYESFIVPFSGYGFNKSHSVAYSLLAYQTAYLKANHPSAFMQALLNSAAEEGNLNKIKHYLKEAFSLRLTVLAPSINESEADFFSQEELLFYGLAAIKNVGRSLAKAIAAERHAKGNYRSFLDFYLRLNQKGNGGGDGLLNKQAVEALIKAGSFSNFDLDAGQLLRLYPNLEKRASKEKSLREKGQTTFFDFKTSSPTAEKEFSAYEDLVAEVKTERTGTTQLQQYEVEALGFSLCYDPVQRYRAEFAALSDFSRPSISPAAGSVSKKQTIAGVVEQLRTTHTKRDNKEMMTLTLNTGAARLELVIFPKEWEKIKQQLATAEGKDRLVQQQPAVFKVQVLYRQQESPTVMVKEVECFNKAASKLKRPAAPVEKKLYFQLVPEEVRAARLEELKAVLKEFCPGENEVYFYFEAHGRKSLISLGSEFKVSINNSLKKALASLRCLQKIRYPQLQTS